MSISPERSAFIAPMPPMAPDDITGTGVLRRIRHNAFKAFPRKCWTEPVLLLSTPVKPLAIVCAPDALRHVLLDHHTDYGRLGVGKRVLGPIVGNGLLVSDGEAWRKQRKAMAPAFAPERIERLNPPSLLITVAGDSKNAARRRKTSSPSFSR